MSGHDRRDMDCAGPSINHTDRVYVANWTGSTALTLIAEQGPSDEDLRQVFEWIGWDRMIYSSDYPHWDFDDPHLAFRFQMTETEKRMLFRDNALSIYTFQ